MISKREGNQFERLFYRSAIRQCFGILQIPDGCKRVGLKKLIPVKTPCDFVLASKGRGILIDTKTQGTGLTFPKANINLSQVHSICSMKEHGFYGGYIVWLRSINKVVFYDCEILRTATEGLHWELGIYLGPIENIVLERLMATGDGNPDSKAPNESNQKILPPRRLV